MEERAGSLKTTWKNCQGSNLVNSMLSAVLSGKSQIEDIALSSCTVLFRKKFNFYLAFCHIERVY